MFDEPLPHRLDIEKTVLGSMLAGGESVAVAVNRIDPEHFYSTANRKIFQCMRGMFEKGVAVDIVTVVHELRKKELLESVGKEPYVTELIESVGTCANMPYYVDILIETATRRRLIEVCLQSADDGFREGADPAGLIGSMREELDRMAKDAGVPSFRTESMEPVAICRAAVRAMVCPYICATR